MSEQELSDMEHELSCLITELGELEVTHGLDLTGPIELATRVRQRIWDHKPED